MGSSGARRQARAAENAAAQQSQAAIQVAQLQSDAAREAAGMQQATALQVAQMQSDAALGAAHATAGATMHAANLSATTARETRELLDQRGQEAIVRSEEAAALALDDIAAGREASLAVQNEQFALANERLEPYAAVGQESLQAVNDAATLDGWAQRLSDMANSDVYNELFSERMEVADARLSAGGMNRSGAAAQEAADLSMATILGLDQGLYGRQLTNVGIGQSAVNAQNSLGMSHANNVTGIETGAAANNANIRTAGANQQGAITMQTALANADIANSAAANQGALAVNGAIAQGNFLTQGAGMAGNTLMAGTNAAAQGINSAAYYSGQGIMGSANALAQGQIGAANARAQGSQNTFNNIMAAGQLAASFFSDPTMKENMEKVGEYGPLNIYEWDWKDEYKDEFGTEMNLGFNADEVEQLYPQYVETQGRKKKIDYEGLMAELQEAA
jgi:hypothetical protein